MLEDVNWPELAFRGGLEGMGWLQLLVEREWSNGTAGTLLCGLQALVMNNNNRGSLPETEVSYTVIFALQSHSSAIY